MMRTFVLVVLCFHIVSSLTTNAVPNPVLDVGKQKVRIGVDYYILPMIRGRGGGLTLSGRRNNPCPLGVVQEQLEVSNGMPVTFSPFNAAKGVVRQSTDLNIRFSAPTLCGEPTVWKLDMYDAASRQYFVTTGGVQGNPGPSTTGNWFKIEKLRDDYKLVFCPSVCKTCKVICKDIGIYVEDGKRRLALSDVPFPVMFKRA